MKVLVATEKPFAAVAVDGIRKVLDEAGYELALLEKYTDRQQLLDAVADADAMWTWLRPRPTAYAWRIPRDRIPMPWPNWCSVWL